MVIKQGIWHKRQGIYGRLGLEKTNIVAFLEVKLLVENRHKGRKLNTSKKLKVS